jgi:hypothetical protein
VAKYPYPFKQGSYYPYPIRIRENCGYPQNIYPRIHIRASLFLSTLCLLAVQRVGYCYDPVCLSVCRLSAQNAEL